MLFLLQDLFRDNYSLNNLFIFVFYMLNFTKSVRGPKRVDLKQSRQKHRQAQPYDSAGPYTGPYTAF